VGGGVTYHNNNKPPQSTRGTTIKMPDPAQQSFAHAHGPKCLICKGRTANEYGIITHLAVGVALEVAEELIGEH
jgi:hypothetical protein